MANEAYIQGRWGINGLYTRPQAIMWSDNFGSNSPSQLELAVPDGTEFNNFLILSDHNRSELRFSSQRIENKKRMVNGRMRSYTIATKDTISWSWENLPSRSFNMDPEFDPNTGLVSASAAVDYTVDGGAGGVELLKWYEDHPGSFWMFMAYDNYGIFNEDDPARYNYLGQYNRLIEVSFSSFEYSVVKRGGNYDLWNVSVAVEEV